MNDALAQLIQQRWQLTPEEVESIRQGDMSALLTKGSASGQDPMSLMLAAMMLGRHSESAHDASDSDRALERAKRIIQKLKEDLAASDTMVKYIAQVFGACSHCWGMNQFCLRCHGRGGPGTADPVEDALLQWVQPALKKIGWRLIEANPDATKQ